MSDLFGVIKTKNNLDILKSELSIISNESYSSSKFDVNAMLEKHSDILRSVLELFCKKNLQDYNHKKFLSEIKSLEETLANCMFIKVTIAISPSPQFVDDLYQWCTSNLADNVLLEIEHDPYILGGALISYDGKFGDYSLVKALEEYEYANI